MKINSFDYFYNKEKDRNCLILGGARSINEINYSNFRGVVISMGDIPIRLYGKCKIDYWIASNSIFPVPDVDFKKINKLDTTTFLFAHSVMRKQNYDIIKKNLKVPWFEYDQRHFGGKACNNQIDTRFFVKKKQDCCEKIGDITLQEYLQKKFNTTGHYSTGETVALHALALAIILGCKRIYIGGVEIPIYKINHNYFNDNSKIDLLKDETGKLIINKYNLKKFILSILDLKIKSEFYKDIPTILKDFEYLNNLCLQNNIRLYNLSSNSILNKINNFKYISPSQIN